MVDRYIDNWGYEIIIPDLTDWSNFEPWGYWSDKFDWIKEPDILEQDVIVFRENTKHEIWDGDTLIKDLTQNVISSHEHVLNRYRQQGWRVVEEANRIIIARVAKMQCRAIYLEVFQSDGKDPLSPMDKIIRDVSQIYRYGAYRWPRDFEPDKNPTSPSPDTALPALDLKSRFVDIKAVTGSGSGDGNASTNLTLHFNAIAKRRGLKPMDNHTPTSNKGINPKIL